MEENFSAKVSITQTTWNGWAIKTGGPTSEIQPPEIKNIKKGDHIELKYMGDHNLEVREITEGRIKLFTNTLVIKDANKGYSLRPEPSETEIKLNETIEVFTPTTDSGAKWEIKLISTGTNETESTHNPRLSQGSGKLVKVKVPKIYFSETQKLITALESKLSGKVIIYYVSGKNMINQDHPDFFLELLRDIGHQEKLSLVIYSTGGDSMASLRIASLLRSYCNNLEVLVPSACTSAATNLALAADKIMFTSSGYLSPIDTQIGDIKDPGLKNYSFSQVSVNSFKRAHEMLEKEGSAKTPEGGEEGAYRTLFKHINPLIFSEVDRHSKRSKRIAETVMKMHAASFENQEKIESIANHLVYDYPAHGYPILYQEAIEIGLPAAKIDDETAYLLWDLSKFYRAATKSVVTTINPGFYHIEEYPVAIETADIRISRYYSFNHRFNPSTKSWQAENDNSHWIKFIPSDSPEKPFIRLPIELEETSEAVKNIQSAEKNPPTDSQKN